MSIHRLTPDQALEALKTEAYSTLQERQGLEMRVALSPDTAYRYTQLADDNNNSHLLSKVIYSNNNLKRLSSLGGYKRAYRDSDINNILREIQNIDFNSIRQALGKYEFPQYVEAEAESIYFTDEPEPHFTFVPFKINWDGHHVLIHDRNRPPQIIEFIDSEQLYQFLPTIRKRIEERLHEAGFEPHGIPGEEYTYWTIEIGNSFIYILQRNLNVGSKPGVEASASTSKHSYRYPVDVTTAYYRLVPDIYDTDAEAKALKYRVGMDAEWSYKYALHSGERFPEGERAIADSGWFSYLYAREILEGPFPEGEPAMARNGWDAYSYAVDILNDRFPAGEEAIASTPETAYNYAVDVLQERFPMAESAIAQSAKYSALYARDVLRGPFPEGEPAILKSEHYSYIYADEALNHPRPEQWVQERREQMESEANIESLKLTKKSYRVPVLKRISEAINRIDWDTIENKIHTKYNYGVEPGELENDFGYNAGSNTYTFTFAEVVVDPNDKDYTIKIRDTDNVHLDITATIPEDYDISFIVSFIRAKAIENADLGVLDKNDMRLSHSRLNLDKTYIYFLVEGPMDTEYDPRDDFDDDDNDDGRDIDRPYDERVQDEGIFGGLSLKTFRDPVESMARWIVDSVDIRSWTAPQYQRQLFDRERVITYFQKGDFEFNVQRQPVVWDGDTEIQKAEWKVRPIDLVDERLVEMVLDQEMENIKPNVVDDIMKKVKEYLAPVFAPHGITVDTAMWSQGVMVIAYRVRTAGLSFGKVVANADAEEAPEEDLGMLRNFNGLRVNVENQAGTERVGIDPDGHEWRSEMKYDYGFIAFQEGEDGEGLDVYLGPNEEADNAYVVLQVDPYNDYEFDEVKVMLGFDDPESAKTAYLHHYDRSDFFGSMIEVPYTRFKDIVMSSGNDVDWESEGEVINSGDNGQDEQ